VHKDHAHNPAHLNGHAKHALGNDAGNDAVIERLREAASGEGGDCSLVVRGVHKTYRSSSKRSVHALRGIDLEITEPGFYGIMGPSGSGKTTLLHLLAALDRPDQGELYVSGQRIDTLSETKLTLFRRRKIGIVFQQFNLVSTLTALDNVTLPAMLDGMNAKERRNRGEELLGRLGLAERAHHRPDALSGGEQQRVAIARALIFSPSVVFADEPTGNLDSATGAHVWGLLRKLAEERNMTVLMVTHEPSAAAHCRRIFVLRDGLIERAYDVDRDASGQLGPRTEQPLR
jgi:putative ABC transport system ATP-binding protein